MNQFEEVAVEDDEEEEAEIEVEDVGLVAQSELSTDHDQLSFSKILTSYSSLCISYGF